jgi:hypothetical protein
VLRHRGWRRQARLRNGRSSSRSGWFQSRRHDWQVLGTWGGFASWLLLKELKLGARLNPPVVSLSRIILGPLNLDEVFMEAEIMSDAVLPAGVVGVVKGEVVADPLVNLSQG